WDSLGRPGIDFDALLFERRGEVLGLLGIAVHEQYARFAAAEHQTASDVVVEELVLEAGRPGGVLGHALGGNLLSESEAALAGLDLDLLAEHLVRAPEDLDLALV